MEHGQRIAEEPLHIVRHPGPHEPVSVPEDLLGKLKAQASIKEHNVVEGVKSVPKSRDCEGSDCDGDIWSLSLFKHAVLHVPVQPSRDLVIPVPHHFLAGPAGLKGENADASQFVPIVFLFTFPADARGDCGGVLEAPQAVVHCLLTLHGNVVKSKSMPIGFIGQEFLFTAEVNAET